MQFKSFLILLGLSPLVALAQNTPNMIPQKAVVRDTSVQTDLIDLAKDIFHIRAKKMREQRDKKIYFSILPISSAAPGGSGRVLITSTTAAVYLGPKRTTNISSVTFAPYWNFKGRFGLPLRANIWLPDNTWTLQSDLRFLVYPQYTWGLGSRNGTDERILVDYNYIRFHQNALKRIKPYFFAGFGYNLDYRFKIKTEDSGADLKTYTGYAYGTGSNSFSSGLSVNLLYDTRNNSINPLPGAYSNLVYRVNPGFLGSNNNWQSLFLDMRKYFSLDPSKPEKQNTLALWSYLWTVVKGNAPYLDLPSTGWDPFNRSARGIEQNRYRGKTLFYLESEYRRDITANGLLGFVVFANVNSVSGSRTLFTSWHPAAGTGLRVKFNKGSNTNIGIDFAASKGFNTFVFNLGEAF